MGNHVASPLSVFPDVVLILTEKKEKTHHLPTTIWGEKSVRIRVHNGSLYKLHLELILSTLEE